MKRLILILLALPGISFAQETETEPPRRVIYQKATEIDFNEVEVDAALNRPGIVLSIERSRVPNKSLAELRKNFNPEMEASADDVK